MPNEQSPNPIGDPIPIDPAKGRKVLAQAGAVVGVAIGGMLVFALIQRPAYAKGATRSARLTWQQRQREIQQIVIQADAAETNASTGGPQSQSSKPPEH
jgi:hypothetical protein